MSATRPGRRDDRLAGLRASVADRPLLAVVLGAAILRLVWGLIVPVAPMADSVIYLTGARNIVRHGAYAITLGEPFAYWPVGPSAVYAIALRLLGEGMAAVVAANLVAGTLLVWTTGLLARRWFGGAAGPLAAVIVALWPTLIMFTTVLQSEIFFCVGVNAVLLLWQPTRAGWWWRAGLAGLTAAAACFMRPTALLLPLILLTLTVVGDAAGGRVGWRPFAFAGLALAVMGLSIAPWAQRNAALFGEPVLIATNGAANLWMGNNPETEHVYMPLPERVAGLSETERAHALGEEAKAYMTEDPLRTLRGLFVKAWKTHRLETIGVTWNEVGLTGRLGGWAATPLKLVTQGFWMLVLALGIGGAALTARRAVLALRENGPLAGLAGLAAAPVVLWAYYASVHAVVVGGQRYHLPSAPFIAALAALALLALYERLGAGRPNPGLLGARGRS